MLVATQVISFQGGPDRSSWPLDRKIFATNQGGITTVSVQLALFCFIDEFVTNFELGLLR